MPHDRDGQKIEVGDLVNLPCRVLEVSATEDLCNVMLETVEPFYPNPDKQVAWHNAKQVVKQEVPAEGCGCE